MAGRKKTEPTIETVFDEEVAAANSKPEEGDFPEGTPTRLLKGEKQVIGGYTGKPDTSGRARQLQMGQKPKAKKEETDG